MTATAMTLHSLTPWPRPPDKPIEMNRSVALFAILTLVFAALFAADLQGRFNIARDPVAVLGSTEGTVRRLGRGQLTWDRAARGTLFGMGDTISTGENAAAKLAFYAGGELELDPGAMVVLSGNLEELQLSFVSGKGRIRVTRETAKKIKVSSTPPPEIRRRGAVRKPATNPASAPGRGRIEVIEVAASELDIPPRPSRGAPKEAPVRTPTRPMRTPTGISAAISEAEIRNPSKAMSTGGELASAIRLPPSPEVTFPGKDAVIDLSDGGIPELRWSVSESALNEYTVDQSSNTEGSAKGSKLLEYEVILRPAQGVGPTKILKSRSPSLPLTRVSGGKYLWTVRSVTTDGKRSPASEARWLEVRVPAQISRPKILPVRIE